MYLRKRSKTWCCEVRRKGDRVYKGGFKTKKAAKEWGDK
jgi:hypothetical protein